MGVGDGGDGGGGASGGGGRGGNRKIEIDAALGEKVSDKGDSRVPRGWWGHVRDARGNCK